jgi:hypothetical protein
MIESSAQAYASNCIFAHSSGDFYGENTYISSDTTSTNPLTDAGAEWWHESTTEGLDDPWTTMFDTFDFTAQNFTQVILNVNQ